MKRFVKIGIVFVLILMLFEGTLAIASDSYPPPIQLTTDDESDGAPSWSSNNSKIAFRSHRSGSNSIWKMNTDGTNQIQLTDNLGDDGQPHWSADDSKIVFESNRSGIGIFGLWIRMARI